MIPGIVFGIRGYKRFDKRNKFVQYDVQPVSAHQRQVVYSVLFVV